IPAFKVTNSAPAPSGTRTIEVDNGLRTTGWVGSIRLTSVNRLQESVVTTLIGPPGGAVPSYFDKDPVTGAGIVLVKAGTGVLGIEGPNEVSSTGAKTVLGGVLRFGTAV